ncbi:MAG: hypothetical protein IJN68_06385 [Clostridia bacterium]|nr:hypothetical protein [Oscillospiraceae bacterium]MBQ7006042.1 hypothetical protein [Clostridia bacterium]
MKKALSLVLALLVAFSMFAVVASAEGESTEPVKTVTLVFRVDGEVYQTVEVQAGVPVTPYTPENPVKQNTDEIRYTFKGWRSTYDGQLYYKSTIPTPDGTEGKITFDAEFSEEDISERQSFWNLIESIFERINKIFQYFAIVFNW